MYLPNLISKEKENKKKKKCLGLMGSKHSTLLATCMNEKSNQMISLREKEREGKEPKKKKRERGYECSRR